MKKKVWLYLYCYQIEESERSVCDNVEEGNIAARIVEGPPASGCSQDSERWPPEKRIEASILHNAYTILQFPTFTFLLF